MPNLDFFITGNGPVVLFLHGWGQNKEMMIPLTRGLEKTYPCVVIDMPGFGNSEFNNEKDVDEYTKSIHDFLIYNLHLTPTYIVGHSFGGKIAVNYHLKYGVRGICLIASPVLKAKRSIVYYYKVILHKLKKRFKIKSNMGSVDYKNAKDEMKNFFVNVVNTYYDKKIKNIKIPVLMIYSKDDKKVDYKSAKKLEKKLLRTRLRVIKGDHFAYLNNRDIVVLELNNFFKERENHAYYL